MTSPGNQKDTQIMAEADQLIRETKAKDRCEALKILSIEARTNKNTQKRKKIKRTEKALGCRHSRKRKS